MSLNDFSLNLLKLPLKQPYHLAFGDVTHFDTILIRARDADGRQGFGEATLLAEYGGGTVEDAWAFCRARAESLTGMTPAEAKVALVKSLKDQPFAVTAFTSALEMLEGNDVLAPTDDIRVPILGPVNETGLDAIPAEVERLLAEGFGTLKVKVGFDVENDLARVGVIQGAARGWALLRLDGNQGYTVEQACRFATELDPADIELFEQPCAAGDWDAAAAVAEVSPVPMISATCSRSGQTSKRNTWPTATSS